MIHIYCIQPVVLSRFVPQEVAEPQNKIRKMTIYIVMQAHENARWQQLYSLLLKFYNYE